MAGSAGTFTVAATGGASGNPVTFSSAPPSVCTTGGTNGATVTMKSAGNCTITASQAGNSNYLEAVQAQQIVTIGKANQTISFPGPVTLQLGVPASNQVTLTATATSGLAVSFAAAPPAICTVSGATLTMVAAGSCTITASQAGDSNFNAAADVVRTITINAADLANTWTLLSAKLATARYQHTATRLDTGPRAGCVLIAGGNDSTNKPLASTELYTGRSTSTRSLPRATCQASRWVTPLRCCKTARWSVRRRQLERAIVRSHDAHVVARRNAVVEPVLPHGNPVPDGRVLIIGGSDNAGTPLNTTIVYDPAGAGTFTVGPVLDTPRELHTATLLPNGNVLVVGGRKKQGNNYATLATYQLCGASAAMGPITPTASTGGIAGRYAHDAVALGPDGSKVLVAGGASGNNDLATAGVYDASAGTWSNVGLGSLTHGRSD